MNLDYLHPNKQLPYPCYICLKSFKTERDYKVHTTTSILHKKNFRRIGITNVNLAYD